MTPSSRLGGDASPVRRDTEAKGEQKWKMEGCRNLYHGFIMALDGLLVLY